MKFTLTPIFPIFLAFLAGAVGNASADSASHARGVVKQHEVIHYDVTGATAEELRQAMAAAGPVFEGRRFFGFHEWHITWTFQYAPSEKGCSMQDVRVSLAASTTLPRWSRPRDASGDLVSQWETFVHALQEHERGHAANGQDAAREVLQTLRGLHLAHCDGMKEAANTAAHDVLERYRERDRRYDQTTNFGVRQGAAWPPDAAQAGPRNTTP